MLLMELSHLRREAPRGPRALRVTVGSQDHLELWAQKGLLDKKENMASLVAQDDLVCLERKAIEEILLAYQDPRVLQAPLDFQEGFLV